MDFLGELQKLFLSNQINTEALMWALLGLSGLRYILVSGLFLFVFSVFEERLIRIHASPWSRWELFKDGLLSLVSILIFKYVTVVALIAGKYEVCHIYFKISDYGWRYFWISLVLNVIVFDTYFYWIHRFLHKRWMMRHVHIVHHECHNLSIFSAYAFHPVEAFIYPWGVVALSLVMPINLGVWWLMLLLILIQSMIIHCGYTIYPKKMVNLPILKYIMQPIYHDAHHNGKPGYNYGLFFNVWDRMVGTFYLSELDD
jgi:Delta7-sterol 5-desaturase